jgi:DNA-binding transcriptional LysR family regulator
MAVTLAQLRAFVAVARTGSVQRAADELYLSQPSVSAAVAALARELGVELLEREGRGVRLSPAGAAFAPYAREVLGLLGQGAQAAREAERPQSVRIRIAAVHTAGEYLLPPLLRAYRELHPESALLLEIGNRQEVTSKVVAGEADVGVGGRPLVKGLSGRPFLDNLLIVVGSEPTVDLAQATWLFREEGSGTRAAAERYLDERGITPREHLTLGSNTAIKQALALGLGVTLTSEHAVLQELRSGELVRIPAPGTPIRRAWYTFTASRTKPRPSVRRFLAFLHSDEAQAVLRSVLQAA